MAHGITETDGMMYTGAAPWHRLGKNVEGVATAEQAISAAGLDWNVVTEPVYVQGKEVPNKVAVVREDTGLVMGIFGDGYQVAQNRGCFGMMDELVMTDEAVYHTAGSIHGGKRIWMLAKLPDDIKVIPGDTIQPYILLTNSHDGSSALRIVLTPIRVVCANTLTVALRAKEGTGFYGKHTRNLLTRAGEARELLGVAKAYFDHFGQQVDELVNTRMTVLEVERYLQELYEFKQDKTYAEQDHRVRSAYEGTLEQLGHPTNTIGGMSGTKWAAYNAVTRYIDHERPVRITGAGLQADDKRLDNSWFGAGVQTRQKAYDLLVR